MTQPKPNKDEALFFRAAFEPQTFNETNRTVELTWTTGASVKRYDWNRNRYYMESLKVDNDAVDFSRLENGAPLLANHSSYSLQDVIGVVERAWIDKGIGKATVRFSERDDVKPILQDVKTGILRAISVGYSIDTVTIEERENELPIYTATRWTPMEISLVTIPADVGAQVRSNEIILNQQEATMPETQEVRHEQASTPPVVDLTAIRSEAIKAERERIAEIKDAVRSGRLDDSFAEKLITDGIDANQARKLVLDELVKIDAQAPTQARGGSDIRIISDETDKLRTAAADSILGRAGILKGEEKQAKLQGNPFTQFRAREIARQCLEMTGENVSRLSDDEIVKRAFTSSTSDFPVILESVLNRTVLASYTTVGETWRRFCATGSVSDFRQWKRLKLASLSTLDSVTELGEFKNKSLNDAESESISVNTFGNIVNISRQMIVNDDLGAFLNVSTALGKAAALTVEKAVYSLLLANPTMSDGVALFHANHGNLQSTGTALSVTAVDADRVAMAQQMDIGKNDYLDIKPSILVLPTALGGTARVINNSQFDPDAANKLQRVNMVAGLFSDIIDTPRLTGTSRYYFADPNVMPAFEVAFLNGNDTPYLEQENGFDVDGVKYKVRLDFGVAAIEHRAVYKNVGA